MTTDNVTRYDSTSGRAFVYVKNFPTDHGDVLFSSDGQTFHELRLHGIVGDGYDHHLSFDHPDTAQLQTLRLVSGSLKFDGEVFLNKETPFSEGSVVVVKLEEVRVPYWLGQGEDGTYVLVSEGFPRHDKPFRLFVGAGIIMRQYEVDEVDTIEKDNEWYVRTVSGEILVVPHSGWSDAPPLWCEKYPLTILDPNDFNIVESEAGQVTIQPK